MDVHESGAVCDVSVLGDRDSFELAQKLLDGGELYLPSATYAWLTRDRLISVRRRTIGYSLVSQFVRDRKLLVIHLPELFDELSRRLLFDVDQEVPLTDIRATMLAAHLQVPLLAFGDETIERLREHVAARLIWQLDTHADWFAMGEVLELYRELASDVGSYLYKNLNDERAFDGLVNELRSRRGDSLQATTKAVQKLGQTRTNPGKLNFRYLTWDLTPLLSEYLKQHVLQPEVVRELCERVLLLVATPKG